MFLRLATLFLLLGLVGAVPAFADSFVNGGAAAAPDNPGGGGEQPPEDPPPQPDPPNAVVPLRIDSGAVVPFTDGSANVWGVDEWASSGNIASFGAQAIAGTTDDTLYQTERWQAGGFEYRIRIANGTYDFTSFHAENVFNAAGARVFDILCEGVECVSDYDPYVDAGNAKNTATSETVSDIVVTDGELNIFYRAQTQNPQVNAILVTLAEPDAPPPPAPSCSPLTQSVETGATASFTAAEGTGTFSWSAPGGTPSTGSGSSFETVYSTAGVKTVTVTSGVLTAACDVSVTAPPAYPEVLGSATTAIETTASAAPTFRARVGLSNDSATEDTATSATTTAAVGETVEILCGLRDQDSSDTATTVTYGAQTATLGKAQTSASGHRRVEAWYVLSASTANATATCNYSGDGPGQDFIIVNAYTGVDSIGATGAKTGSTDNWDVDITTNRANSLISAIGVLGDGSAEPFTIDDTETERTDGTTSSGSGSSHLSYHHVTLEKAAAGAENLGGAGDVAAQWTAIAVELRSAGGVAPAITISGSGGSGDKYLILGCSGSTSNIDTPDDWAALSGVNGVFLPNNAGRLWAWQRTADASWPASFTTVPFTMAADQETAWVMLTIEDHRSSTTPLHGAQNGGQTTASPDPPLLNTSSGAPEDVLALELFIADETSNTSPYVSSGYTAVAQVESSGTAGSCGINIGRKNVSGPFEDPGTMSNGASEEAVAATIFIYYGTEGAGTAPTPAPVCLPSSQAITAGDMAAFSATDGDGTFAWSAPSGSPSSGSGSTFSTIYSAAGSYTVTVTSASQTDTCSVTVTAAQGGGPGATGHWQVGTDGRLYEPDGDLSPPLRGGNLFRQDGSASFTDYMSASCWNSDIIRLNVQNAGSAPSGDVLSEIEAYRDAGQIVIVDWHLVGGYSAATINDTIDFFTALSAIYGTRGATPDEGVWYQMYNEPGGGTDTIISGGNLIWDPAKVTLWQNWAMDVTDAIRVKADAPIIIPSMKIAQDIHGTNSAGTSGGFQFDAGFAMPLTERSAILKHGQVIVDNDPLGNIIWDIHAYGNYRTAARKAHMDAFLAEIAARGQMVLWGEYGSLQNSGQDSTQSSRNIRDLRLENGGRYFLETVWHFRSDAGHRLTTTAPVSGQYGIRDITGAGTAPTCTGTPNNLSELGQIVWDGTH